MDTNLTVVFSTRKHNQEFIDHIENTCKIPNVEILAYINEGDRSLTEIYNDALKKAKNDIILYIHDDIIFETPYWGKKLLNHFKRNPDYGIMGIAGTNYLYNGQWWSIKESMHGILNHSDGQRKWGTMYSRPQGNLVKDMVVLDGVFFAVDRTKIKKTFDESFKGFHFYDISFCFENYINDVKIGVFTDIIITHLSVGKTNEKWELNKKLFEEKYIGKLPAKARKNIKLNNKVLINIITRTSNRPNSFKKCCESIDMQTYKNINHIVCTDNESDQEYVRKHGRNPILIDRISLIDNDKSVNPNTGKYSPHNLYFNEAQKHVKDGWVMYLDDDDVLMHTNAIEEFVIAIEKANPLTLIFWQMKFLGKPTPGIVNEKNPPRLGTLGTSCFGFHSKHLEHVIWDGWKCGDFRVIEKLYNKLPYNVFIPEVLVYVPEPGSGLKKDINE